MSVLLGTRRKKKKKVTCEGGKGCVGTEPLYVVKAGKGKTDSNLPVELPGD